MALGLWSLKKSIWILQVLQITYSLQWIMIFQNYNGGWLYLKISSVCFQKIAITFNLLKRSIFFQFKHNSYCLNLIFLLKCLQLILDGKFKPIIDILNYKDSIYVYWLDCQNPIVQKIAIYRELIDGFDFFSI